MNMKSKRLKLSGMMLAGIIIIVTFVYAVEIQPVVTGDVQLYTYRFMTFTSYEEFSGYLQNHTSSNGYSMWHSGSAMPANVVFDSRSSMEVDEMVVGGKTVDFSETNIQVEGVDEPDIVKTDGTYLYLVSGQKVFIIQAWPASDATIVAEISLDYYINNIFINEDRLIIFGNSCALVTR